jgi:hypothetical protein
MPANPFQKIIDYYDSQSSTLTEEERETLVQVGDEFWLEFSALCNRYIARAPSHLTEYYAMYLGEKTSIYGRKTS